MEQNNFLLELSAIEKRRLIKILEDKYMTSLNLFEVAETKSILQKLGQKVKDWIPPLEDLTNQENVV